jgi:sulfite reductase (NADPH) hemoprotein beta-component
MDTLINWDELSEVEKVKYESNYLRGTLTESLADPITGAIAPADTHLIKFHGMYQQTDRDLDKERKTQKLEPFYSFLIRVRIPGGVVTPKQWLQMDALAGEFANGTLKITTRQTFQLHGVIKQNLRPTIQKMNDCLLDTIAACGDVNRNVMSHANPAESPFHREIFELAGKISAYLLPKTGAYHEIWLETNWWPKTKLKVNRCTVIVTCRVSLKLVWWFRLKTTAMYFRRTLVLLPLSKTGRLQVTMSWQVAVWAQHSVVLILTRALAV